MLLQLLLLLLLHRPLLHLLIMPRVRVRVYAYTRRVRVPSAYPVQVYVLGRMGAHREALALMLTSLQDIKGAVEFVRTSREPELWQTLLSHAMASPPLVEDLLLHVSAEPLRTLDTLALVQQLPEAPEIPLLPQRLAAILSQAGAKLELTRAALDVAHADCGTLLRERHQLMQRGMTVLPPSDASADGAAPVGGRKRASSQPRFDLLPGL